MRVVIAPDSFGDTLDAVGVAGALAAGWRTVAPADELDLAPLSDGGPGLLAALGAAGARPYRVAASDPIGRPLSATVLVRADSAGLTAWVESAQVVGLHLLAAGERDPLRASSAGLAPVLLAAAALAPRVVVGLGGSGTSDAGRGLLAALDAAARRRLSTVELVAATDVDNPLLGPDGAARVYGPQKGADAAAVAVLEARAAADVAAIPGGGEPRELAGRPGAGAAGGLGWALFLLGARRESGAALVARAVGLPARIAAADLVLTGEGRLDEQTVRGKVPVAVAALAAEYGVPCVAVAGQVTLARRQLAAYGFTAAHPLAAAPEDLPAALARPADLLQQRGARLARHWSPPRDR